MREEGTIIALGSVTPINGPGALITVGTGEKLGANTDIIISTKVGKGRQDLEIHTSCSQEIYAGDIFGALTVVDFECYTGGGTKGTKGTGGTKGTKETGGIGGKTSR